MTVVTYQNKKKIFNRKKNHENFFPKKKCLIIENKKNIFFVFHFSMASINMLVLKIVLHNLAPVKRERFQSVPDTWKDRLCYFYILYRLESKDCTGTLRMPPPSQEVVECLRKNKVIPIKHLLYEDYYGYKKQQDLNALIEVVGKKRFGYQKDYFCNLSNEERFRISQAVNEHDLRYLRIEKPHDAERKHHSSS